MNIPTISYFGNEDLIERKGKKAFLCSHQVPDETFSAIRKWTEGLDPQKDCVVCGCLSGIERFTLKLLVSRRIPLIITLAEKMPEHIKDVSLKFLDIDFGQMMGEGQLLFASFNNTDETAPTGRNAEHRNRWMINISSEIILAYAQPKGRLSIQLCGLSNVTTLVTHTGPVTYTPAETLDRALHIYYYLRTHHYNMSILETKRMLLEYLKLDIEKPSELHSKMLSLVTSNNRYLGTDFNFTSFFKMWGINNLREEDWKRFRNKKGQYLDSTGEQALNILVKQKEQFKDNNLIQYMAKQAVRYYPKNSQYQKLIQHE